MFSHSSLLLEMWNMNLMKIPLKRSCISPLSSMIFVTVTAKSLHWIIIYDLVSMSCHHHHCPYINLWLGCATPVQLIMNPHNQYLPIPSSSGSHSIGPSASPSIRNSPEKRSRTEALQGSSCETPPRSKYTVPTELELNVKGLYQGTCVITGHSFSWGRRMVAGPGIETCHIIPKSMYYWHPNQQLSPEEMWNQVNSTVNCMTMDSVCHTIHDNRLLAVHHVRFIQALCFSCC